MKAAIFEKQGLENLKVIDVGKPKISYLDVLINVKITGINPLDHIVVSNAAGPMPKKWLKSYFEK